MRHLVFLLSIIFSFHAFSMPKVIKLNEKSGQGLCLPEAVNQISAEEVLKENKVRVYTGETGECEKTRNKKELTDLEDLRLINLAKVIYTLHGVGSKVFTLLYDVEIIFGTNTRKRKCRKGKLRSGYEHNHSRQKSATEIHYNPSNQNITGAGSELHGGTHNIALMVHESGHLLGNSLFFDSEETFYTAYNKAVPEKCYMSTYPLNHFKRRGHRNEEFAEAYTAYITDPGLFLDGGKACSDAFKFFVNAFGERNINMSCQSRNTSVLYSKTFFDDFDIFHFIPIPDFFFEEHKDTGHHPPLRHPGSLSAKPLFINKSRKLYKRQWPEIKLQFELSL